MRFLKTEFICSVMGNKNKISTNFLFIFILAWEEGREEMEGKKRKKWKARRKEEGCILRF